MVEGVDTEVRRGGGGSKASSKDNSRRRKKKSCIRFLELVVATYVLPKDAAADAEKGNGGWEGRRSSIIKRMQRVLFAEIPDSGGNENFHKKKDNAAVR